MPPVAAEDRFAALEAIGQMQQVFVLEFEDVMSREIAEVGDDGSRRDRFSTGSMDRGEAPTVV